jgi:phage terminase large subunit-like protein
MARPSKSLEERIRGRSFLARRHGGLLAGPLVGPEDLRELQAGYQTASTDRERRSLALDYEQAVRTVRSSGGRVGITVSAPAAFFKKNLRHQKGPAAGRPFVLEPWQRRFVDELYKTDEHGHRIFKRAILGVPRGNGKSPMAAAIGLYELMTRTDEPDIICAAAARDQAGVVFEYARGYAESGPLIEHLLIGRREIARPETSGVLRTISADGYVAHGANPSAVIIDEAHAFTTDKQRELFEAADTAVIKRPDAFWLMITTAGHDRGSLLGRLYGDVLEQLEPTHSKGLTIARDEANGVLLYWYGASEDCDPDDEKLWKAVNPASWVTVPDLRRQRRSPSMATGTFKRRHLNAWVAPDVERWLPGDAWEALCEPESRIEAGAALTVGGDGSRSYDTSALAWASRAEDGRIDVACRVFSVRADVPHHVLHEGRIDYEDIQDSLLELAERFSVREVAFDPRYIEPAMETVAGRLGASHVFPVEPHSRLHREALACFERSVLEGVLRHAGDPVMAEQLAWTGVDRYENGDPRRLRKLERTRPIDVSVALALAVWRVVLGANESVYATRPLTVIATGAIEQDEAGSYLVDGEPLPR